MARIRTIKPDFWDSPAVAKASLRARLLYIAMWNWADDFGIGDANPWRLWSFAFPNDDPPEMVAPEDPAHIPPTLRRIPPEYAEIANLFGVIFYEHEGRPYYWIPSWEKHQKLDRRSVQRVPFPNEDAPRLFVDIPRPPEPADIPPTSHRNMGVGTEELGTEELGTRNLKKRTASAAPEPYSPEFEAWWQHYPVKKGKKRAYPAFKKALQRASIEELTEGAIGYGIYLARNPDRSPKFAEGWLNDDRWADEPDPPPRQRSVTDDRVQGWLNLANNHEPHPPNLKVIGR